MLMVLSQGKIPSQEVSMTWAFSLLFYFYLIYLLLETGPHNGVQAGFKLIILLPWPPEG